MTLTTYYIENISEERLSIKNIMSAITGHRYNLNCHVICNVILASIDEHMEEAEVTF